MLWAAELETEQLLPPGPRLPRIAQNVLLLARPLEFLTWCRARYGQIFTLRLLEFGTVVYVADPEAIRDVFAADADIARAGAANRVLEPVTGPGSILLLDKGEHLSERRLLLPAFHGEALERLQGVVSTAAEREIATLPTDRPVALRPAMQRITFEVIVRAVLGWREPARREELLGLLAPVFDISPWIAAPILRVDLGPLSPWGRFLRARRRLDGALHDLISQRRDEPPRADVLGLLLGATDEHGRALPSERVRDELVTLLLAGHETTASALAWAFERLARTPRATARLQDGLRDGDRAYLDAVIAETLRVRPVVMDVARKLAAPLKLAGYRIPAGATVMPGIALMQLDERHHPRPGEFEPERFLDSDPPPGTWLPFGGGRRRCLGAALATMEMLTVISALLERRALEPVDPQPERPRIRGVTLVPERDALVVLRPLHAVAVPRAHGAAGGVTRRAPPAEAQRTQTRERPASGTYPRQGTA